MAAVDEFIDLVRRTFVHGRVRSGCPVAAVALGADADGQDLVRAAARAFEYGNWRSCVICVTMTRLLTGPAASLR